MKSQSCVTCALAAAVLLALVSTTGGEDGPFFMPREVAPLLATESGPVGPLIAQSEHPGYLPYQHSPAPRLPSADLPCPEGPAVTVIYNALVWPAHNWRDLIGAQLRHLQATGLPECASVYIALSVPETHPGRTVNELLQELAEATAFVKGLPGGGDFRITTFPENAFEYPGVKLMWTLAQEVSPAAARDHVFLYFHTKGMVNHGNLGRTLHEYRIFHGTIEPWRHVLEVFSNNARVDMVGMYPADAGWVWYNFFWARASHLRTIRPPIKTDNRYYYESWLTTDSMTIDPIENHCQNCWSTCANGFQAYSHAHAASLPGCTYPYPESRQY